MTFSVPPTAGAGAGAAVGGAGVLPPDAYPPGTEWCGGVPYPDGCPPGLGKEVPVDLKSVVRDLPVADILYWHPVTLPGGWTISLISTVAFVCLAVILVSTLVREVSVWWYSG